MAADEVCVCVVCVCGVCFVFCVVCRVLCCVWRVVCGVWCGAVCCVVCCALCVEAFENPAPTTTTIQKVDAERPTRNCSRARCFGFPCCRIGPS